MCGNELNLKILCRGFKATGVYFLNPDKYSKHYDVFKYNIQNSAAIFEAQLISSIPNNSFSSNHSLSSVTVERPEIKFERYLLTKINKTTVSTTKMRKINCFIKVIMTEEFLEEDMNKQVKKVNTLCT